MAQQTMRGRTGRAGQTRAAPSYRRSRCGWSARYSRWPWRYDEDLDAAFEQAREQGDVTPLVQTVKRWWFEADAWRDPQAQREFLARIDTYRDGGPPPAEQRVSREEIRTQFGV
jgi:hypothetical protein